MGSDVILKELKRRTFNILIGIDQLLWVLFTLGNGMSDETISAASYRMKLQGKVQGKVLVFIIDWLFHLIEKDHCYLSYLSEVNKKQLPDFYNNPNTRK